MFVTKLGHYPIVLGIPWLELHNVAIRFSSRTLTFGSQYCIAHCNIQPTVAHALSVDPSEPILTTESLSPIHIAAVGATSFHRTAYRKRLAVFSLSLYEINKALDPTSVEKEVLTKLIPEEYHEFLPLFSEVEASALPPHRPYDHKIPLKEGFVTPFGPLYSLSRPELVALKEWLDENLQKGFIRASSSPAGSPILFVKKSDGSLRLCVDYRGLN